MGALFQAAVKARNFSISESAKKKTAELVLLDFGSV